MIQRITGIDGITCQFQNVIQTFVENREKLSPDVRDHIQKELRNVKAQLEELDGYQQTNVKVDDFIIILEDHLNNLEFLITSQGLENER